MTESGQESKLSKPGGSALSDIEDNALLRQRLLELEQELVEFQESSRELEQALEEELRDLETQNETLVSQAQAKDAKIKQLNDTILQLSAEVNTLSQDSAERTASHEKEMAELRGMLVTMEISNDDIVSNDRVLQSKLHLATQFNNELLEKIAMVENDLELERQENAKHRLTISNLSNNASMPRKMSRSKRLSSFANVSLADGTILDIEEMLATEPAAPPPVTDPRMTRSESLTKFHDLCTNADALRQKVGAMNYSLALKADPTAIVSTTSDTGSIKTPSKVTRASSRDDLLRHVSQSKNTVSKREKAPAKHPERKKMRLRSVIKTIFPST